MLVSLLQRVRVTPSLRLVINWDAREPFANAPGAETYRRETIESRFPERIIPEECCSTQLGLSLTPPRRSAVGGNTRRLAVPGAPAAERRIRPLAKWGAPEKFDR